MRALPLALALVALALLASACQRTAELIPGEATPLPTATATPAPLVAPTPIVPPAALGVAGATADTLAEPAIPDVELARSVVQISLIASASGIVQTVRAGSGARTTTGAAASSPVTSAVTAPPTTIEATITAPSRVACSPVREAM